MSELRHCSHQKNRPGAKSAVSSVTSSSLPVWDGRFKSQELVGQEARFDAGEESRCKANLEQVAIVMRNARTIDNTRLFSVQEWGVEKPNPSALFKAICFKKKCFNASTSSTYRMTWMTWWKRKSGYSKCMKCMINYQSSIQYTMIHTIFVIYVRHITCSSVHLTLKC